MKYESIKHAAIELALENGGINRSRPIVEFLDDLHDFLRRYDDPFLIRVNEWLVSLSEDDLRHFVAGEDKEMARVSATGPDGVDELFDDMFEEVV